MDTETTNKPAVRFDVFALSNEGYEVHVQLSGDKAYTAALKLLETMSRDGFTPRPGNSRSYSNGNHKSNGNGNEEHKVCSVHNAHLKRYENSKGEWYSHKLADGTWCNGKAN